MNNKKTILIVDDLSISRTILEKILCYKYDILAASNGQEALECLKENSERVSLIILDIIMPIMDGYEFLTQKNQEPAFAPIPVIVTTQNGSSEDEINALACGASDYLPKPYVPQILLHRVESIIKLYENSNIVNILKNDSVTGLYTQEFFYSRAGELIKNHQPGKYTIICSDISSFKMIGEVYGQKSAENLLGMVTDNMMKNFAKYNVIGGRIRADIFCWLVEDYNDIDETVFECVNESVSSEFKHARVIIKFGIYKVNDININVSTMCERALLVIDTIKNKYDAIYKIYDEDIRQKLVDEQSIIDEMEKAIEEKQFKVYFQPKYNLKNNRITGAEALVRWVHPTKGIIPPIKFIPTFEHNGTITKLDSYVWDETCRLINTWKKENIVIVPVSVNVSRADIFNIDVIDIIEKTVKKYDIEPSSLHLEITESAYTDNPKQIISTVNELRKKGFIIEMDDFGSGYSSLSMLSELPIDILKLDMSFIRRDEIEKNNKNILSFVISLAKWLSLQVIAEGVETEEQVQRLVNMDCDYGQGYYFAKPLPEEQFHDLLLKDDIDNTSSVIKSNDIFNLVASEKSNDLDKATMLVVDDMPINRAVIAKICSKDYNIVEANNGKAAYDYLLENSDKVDIIMLDLIMPIMDGFEFLRIVKDDERLNKIPIIVTSQGVDKNEEKLLALGVQEFASKPFIPSVMLHRVKNVLAISKSNK